MYKLLKKALLIIICLEPAFVHAANGTPANGFSLNPVLIGLVSLMLILLFVIGITTHVLRQLVTVYRERLRKERKKAKGILPALLTGLILLTLPAVAAEEAVAAAPGTTYISGIAAKEFYALISIIGFELIVLLCLLLNIRLLIRLSVGKPEVEKAVKAVVRRSFLDRFNKSVSMEKETGILLGHDYDGIRELDNDLPPWWKYGFYFTIVISVIYMWYYHVGSGPSSHEEFVTEVQRGEAEVAAYLAANAGNIDEQNVTMIEDQMALAEGIKIYGQVCAACHANDGGGGIGPNLTDPYWLHGGSLSDVFKSIKYGFQDKGMKSWKDDYSPRQLAALASYIMTLQGTTPAAPKEPQGPLYNTPEAEAPATSKPAETESI